MQCKATLNICLCDIKLPCIIVCNGVTEKMSSWVLWSVVHSFCSGKSVKKICIEDIVLVEHAPVMYEIVVWQLLDIEMNADGSVLLSTGPLSMTVDSDTLAAAAVADADGIGRHLTTNWWSTSAAKCRLCSLDTFHSVLVYVDLGCWNSGQGKCRNWKWETNQATYFLLWVWRKFYECLKAVIHCNRYPAYWTISLSLWQK